MNNSVDGSLINAWAPHKSCKDDNNSPPSGRNPDVDFRSEKRSNKTHQSKTDPEARLAHKSSDAASRLCHMAHILTENRNGLVVDVSVSKANGYAENVEPLNLLLRNANAEGVV
jgi:hypothetical protein